MSILETPVDDGKDDDDLERTVSTSTSTKVFTTTQDDDDDANNTQRIYFIGKLLWAKGLDLLLELEEYTKELTGDYFPIAVYGSGPDQKEIARAFLGRKYAVKEEEDNTTTPGKNRTGKKHSEQQPSKKTKPLPSHQPIDPLSNQAAARGWRWTSRACRTRAWRSSRRT